MNSGDSSLSTLAVGAMVGATEGWEVGKEEGVKLGLAVGKEEGELVG